MSAEANNPTPFRFLDLPLELQCNILQKYYEEPWTITTKQDSDSGPLKYTSRQAFAPLLVSHHFSTEARLALLALRNGTIQLHDLRFPKGPEFFDATIRDIYMKPAFFDAGIKHVCIDSELLRIALCDFRERFPAATVLTIILVRNVRMLSERDLRRVDIVDIARGNVDVELAERARALCFRVLRWWQYDVGLRGFTIVFTMEKRVDANPGWNDLYKSRLCIEVQIDEGGCKVVRKYLREYAPGTETFKEPIGMAELLERMPSCCLQKLSTAATSLNASQ
ncbi:hypothetical protein PMZ80_007075 [Knufia obscura]|uniref:Uncharacterized protein n=1 Tax=Knufia obscura TaxID=1635080 RepID=A0ABR0RKB3_9EURO|nr:hypothetical protein PMZ80_007075 [Knufia obscura]